MNVHASSSVGENSSLEYAKIDMLVGGILRESMFCDCTSNSFVQALNSCWENPSGSACLIL